MTVSTVTNRLRVLRVPIRSFVRSAGSHPVDTLCSDCSTCVAGDDDDSTSDFNSTCPYILSQNSYSYVCSAAKVMEASLDTSGAYSFACMQPNDDTASVRSGSLACDSGSTIECIIYGAYGNVAGSCDECTSGQSCGTCQDCTAKDRCGYSDYGCYGNCVDCFGTPCDSMDGSGSPACEASFPETFGLACVGQSSCNITMTGLGQSAYWVDESGTQVAVSDSAGDCNQVNENSKLKVLALCSASAEAII